MNRFPGLEATILKTLGEEGEVSPPPGRLAEEYFWQAASRLQGLGLCVADQVAGVVRRPRAGADAIATFRDLVARAEHGDRSALEALGQAARDLIQTSTEGGADCCVPKDDLPTRLRLLLRRWKAKEGLGRDFPDSPKGAIYRQCAIDLEEVMEECGVKT